MSANGPVEFLLGGIAACGAGFCTNPLEVAKTRMQLQGELLARGRYTVHYRNAVHALYTVGRTDGLRAIQSGLVPALYYQFFMNGCRLGTFQVCTNLGLTRKRNGETSYIRTIAAGAFAGTVGAFVGSPFYMIKTHFQSSATDQIAVGHQHKHSGMVSGLIGIFREHGIAGLWRGVGAALLRVTIGSAAQLTTFSTAREYIVNKKIFAADSMMNPLLASMLGGIVVTAMMTPFDVVSTRLYNQGIDAKGKGLFYSGVFDCFIKMFKKEGILGFYKGWGAVFLRLAPHTILSLFLWDRIRSYYAILYDMKK